MTATARPIGTGVLSCSETWPCKPLSAQRARLLVRDALREWGIGELEEAGRLVVAELVSNTVKHTRCRLIRVSVSLLSERVRIAVSDRCRDLPVRRTPDGDSKDGRGLLLIESMSCGWGYTPKPWGKVVWADLCVPGDGLLTHVGRQGAGAGCSEAARA
ncbi:ATP-binding protein [Streptomyces luteireticuli]|uniref:ATP-binding protein n=1 Tax=Streptomyces luteireticuli TaxID=173858 RepID=A0ABN0Z8C8_9ACTN